MTIDLDAISSWLGKLGGLPGITLVFLFCIAAIKGLRSIERIPNDGIWLASMLLGCVLYGLIADPMTDTLTFRVWLTKNAVVGGIAGFAAAIAYNTMLKKWVKWFDGQKEKNTDFLGRPPEK